MDVTRIEKHLKWFRLLDSFDSKRAAFYGKYLVGTFVEIYNLQIVGYNTCFRLCHSGLDKLDKDNKKTNRQKKEFNTVMSRQFCNHAMFLMFRMPHHQSVFIHAEVVLIFSQWEFCKILLEGFLEAFISE